MQKQIQEQMTLYGIEFQEKGKYLNTDDMFQTYQQQLKKYLKKTKWFTEEEIDQIDMKKLKQRTKTFINGHSQWRRKRINGKNVQPAQKDFWIFKQYITTQIFFKSPGQINQNLQSMNKKLQQMCLMCIQRQCVRKCESWYDQGNRWVTYWLHKGQTCKCDCHERDCCVIND